MCEEEEEEEEAVPTEVEVIEMDGGRGGELEFLLQTRKVFGQAKGKKSQKGNSKLRPASSPSSPRPHKRKEVSKRGGRHALDCTERKKFFKGKLA